MATEAVPVVNVPDLMRIPAEPVSPYLAFTAHLSPPLSQEARGRFNSLSIALKQSHFLRNAIVVDIVLLKKDANGPNKFDLLFIKQWLKFNISCK